MPEKWVTPETEQLIEGILQLKTADECLRFFTDLCTISELRDMSQRFAVARMLSDGMIYADVVAKTGASTATISRVNNCLRYGGNGYADVIERMKENGL